MSDPRKLYWDSSCFICFLNKDENERRYICEDVLKNARTGTVQIWTSAWTIAEVIRPKERYQKQPLPVWSSAIATNAPAVLPEVEKLWDYFTKHSTPHRKLSDAEEAQIAGMFQWDYLHTINVDQRIAEEAVKISRAHGLKSADAVHAASAIVRKCHALQHWDKGFDRVQHLIQVEHPFQISAQQVLRMSETI